MNRAERRRQGLKNKEPTYSFTMDSLRSQMRIEQDKAFQEQLRAAKDKAVDESRDIAFMLMLALPLKVLMRDYWKKTARDKLPGFVDKVLDLYYDYESGRVSLDELQSDLWEYGNVRLAYREVK